MTSIQSPINISANENSIIPPEDKALLFQAALGQSYSPIVITDAHKGVEGPRIIYANLAFQKMTGYTMDELLGQSPKMLQGPLTDQNVIDKLRTCISAGTHFEGTTINYERNGNPYNVEWSISPIKDSNGVIQYYISVQRNITAFIEAQKERNLLIRALNDSPDCVIITDRDHKIVFINTSFETLTGYSAIEVIGQHPSFLWMETASEQKLDTDSRQASDHLHFQVNKPNVRKNGTLFYVDQSIAHIQDESVDVWHFVSFSRDSTDRLLKENALKDLATKDPLTDLNNRRSGEQLLIHYDEHIKHHGKPVCLVMLDIDDFKKINDTYGHLAGDLVLKTIGRILKAEARSTDNVIRWGGEEFLIIVPDATLQETLVLTERFRKSIADQMMGEVGRVTASFGIAERLKEESTISLINRADKALYKAKLSGKNCVKSAR